MPRITFTRRQALMGTAALAGGLAMPGLVRAASRPMLTHGVQSGDVAHDGAVIWGRADREAEMWVEWSTSDSFRDAHLMPRLPVGAPTDNTGKMALTGLPSDEPPPLDRSPSQIFNSFDTSEFERRAEQAKALLQRCGLNFEAAMDMNTPRGHTPRAHPRYLRLRDPRIRLRGATRASQRRASLTSY